MTTRERVIGNFLFDFLPSTQVRIRIGYGNGFHICGFEQRYRAIQICVWIDWCSISRTDLNGLDLVAGIDVCKYNIVHTQVFTVKSMCKFDTYSTGWLDGMFWSEALHFGEVFDYHIFSSRRSFPRIQNWKPSKTSAWQSKYNLNLTPQIKFADHKSCIFPAPSWWCICCGTVTKDNLSLKYSVKMHAACRIHSEIVSCGVYIWHRHQRIPL